MLRILASLEKGANIVKFRELLKNKEFVFLDGAMGTMLQKAGMKAGSIPEELNITNPDMVIKIHRSYVNSGSDIIYANTFGANRYKLEESQYNTTELISAGIENARKAVFGSNTLVALDIGPIGQLLEPTGSMTFDESYDIYKEQVIAGKDADLVVFETMTDLYELKSAILATKENTDLPIICTMTFEENGRTFTGCSVSAMVLTLEGLGIDAIGVNCSLGPDELYPIIEEISKWTSLPIVIKANAGLPDPNSNTYNVTPNAFAKSIEKMLPLGLKVIGGCCGTTPKYISTLVEILSNKKYTKPSVEKITAVCSATNTCIINRPRIIGERINPTGKKLFKEALLKDDINYILNQAIEQVHGGADILDINVGLPGIDEKNMMIKAVKAVQGVVDVPLQLDSTIPEVLEFALRYYNGLPIVNSVNAEEESLETVLPLVKKYGACVIGLTLDKKGIPHKAEDRVKLAEKIMNRATAIGIPKENIIIDCLTLTASAEQEGVMETLKALKTVKEELGLRTVLGVSNISFGLPNRELINHIFLTMALSYGLDLMIINPNIEAMTSTVKAFNVLSNIDKNSTEYIAHYNGYKPNSQPVINNSKDIDLFYAIENGLKDEGARITSELLKTNEVMSIINDMLIPALDKIGEQYEKGKIFLPQLILSAGVAQSCFEVIKKKLAIENSQGVSKGKIVLATVKNDVHDIGKNIVKVILENYGYDVIDLGKNVDYQTVVDAAIKHNVKLVGLSALMTTTLVSMEETIKLLRDNNVDCKIMVGGAVLTPDYAKKIGADYYSRDAKMSVDIAKEVFGN